MTKKPKQLGFFEEGQDLPLFSQTPVRPAAAGIYNPKEKPPVQLSFSEAATGNQPTHENEVDQS